MAFQGGDRILRDLGLANEIISRVQGKAEVGVGPQDYRSPILPLLVRETVPPVGKIQDCVCAEKVEQIPEDQKVRRGNQWELAYSTSESFVSLHGLSIAVNARPEVR